MPPKTLQEQPAPLLQERIVDVLDGAKVVLFEQKDDKTGKSTVYVRGEFGRADKPTANKRLYPHSLWESQIGRLSPQLKDRKVLGELDHPSDGRTSLQRVSHVLTDLRLEGDLVVGEALILDTAKGRDLRAMLEAGVPVGVSSRGYGSTKSDGKGVEVVQEDFKLVTFDFVAEPADSTAYPNAFFEGVEIPVEALKEASEQEIQDQELAKKFADKVMADAPKPEETLADKFAKKIEDEAAKADPSTLRQEFKTAILDRLADLKKVAYDEARQTLLADPEVAASKAALESIKAALRPFVLSEDAKALVSEREDEIKRLNQQVLDLKTQISEKDELIETLASAAKEAGYKFFLERAIADVEDAAIVRKMVGDVLRFESTDAISEAVKAATAEISARRAAADAENAARTAEEARLRKENEKLAEALEEAIAENERLAVDKYASSRLTNHPKAAKIRHMLENSSVKTKSQVDEVIESFREQPKSAEDVEAARDRVRVLTNGGRGPLREHEEQARSARSSAGNYNGLGVSLSELRGITFGTKGRN